MSIDKVNIQKEIDRIMEVKAKELLHKKKKENVILDLIMENKINNFSIEEIKKLFEKRRS